MSPEAEGPQDPVYEPLVEGAMVEFHRALSITSTWDNEPSMVSCSCGGVYLTRDPVLGDQQHVAQTSPPPNS